MRNTIRLSLRLVRVKVFPENRYFPEMLFSRKENVFMCLVAFQKMFWKIFSDVWLCSWKYHRKHIFYLLLTFSHIFLVTKRIYNIIHSSKHKQNPRKNHQIRTNEGEIAISEIAIGEIAIDVFVVLVMSAPLRPRCRWCRRTAQCRWCHDLFFLSPSLSLFLLFSKAGSDLKWKWKRKWFSVVLALKFGQLEMLFSLTEFEVTTKHPIFRKIISGISLKSIQT